MFHKTSNNQAAAKTETAASKKSQPTVVASDVNFLGNIVSESGVLDIDGKIEGNVRCKTLTIRKCGQVRGDVHADSVQVFGMVHGMIEAREVMLHSTAHVEGVVMHQTLVIEDGAFVDGQLKRIGFTGNQHSILPPFTGDDVDILKSLKLIPEGSKIAEDA